MIQSNIKTIFLFLLFLFFSLLLFYFFYHPSPPSPLSKKPILWRFWQTLPGKMRPGYIDLCYESQDLHCSSSFQIISLNESNIYTYLPYLSDEKIHQTLPIQQRADYYRYHLLRDYGGVWIDADILVVRDLAPIYQNLMQSPYDYQGFGCGLDPSNTDLVFNLGSQITPFGVMGAMNPSGVHLSRRLIVEDGVTKDHPTNWLMMSKPQGRFITRLCKRVHQNLMMISSKSDVKTCDWEMKDYHGLGKDLLHTIIRELKKEKDPSWDYLHFPSLGQEFSPSGKKLNNIFQPFDASESPKHPPRYFFPLYHSAPGYPHWFQNLHRDDFKKPRLLESKGVYLTPILEKIFTP